MKRDHLKTVWAIVALFLLQTVLREQPCKWDDSLTDYQLKSRMMGDYHVRFCERLGVKFPLPTRPRDRYGGLDIGTCACRTFPHDTKASKRAKRAQIEQINCEIV